MIRFNRTTLLLICGAMVGGIVPLTAANASVKSLETKDGLIYDAQAFANGMYIYMMVKRQMILKKEHTSARLKVIF